MTSQITQTQQRYIKTDIVSFFNKKGRKIVGCYDSSSDTVKTEPVVLIPPAYGDTKRDGLFLAYYLVANGFQVLRIDSTDSIGESDGEMLNYSMVTAKEDIQAALDYIEKEFNQSQTCVISTSLAVRQAIKASREDKRISFIIGIVGVVDLQKTLNKIYGEDVIEKLSKGESLDSEIVNTFGFDMSVEGLRSAISGQMHTIKTTLEDLRESKVPTILYFSEKDPWVQYDDIDVSFLRNVEKRYIVGGMHELRENPSVVRHLMRSVVLDLKSQYLGPGQTEVNEPNLREITKQNRREKERVKTFQFNKEAEFDFWESYLREYHVIESTKEFKELLNQLREEMLPLRKEDIFLDVGCGIGLIGEELFRNERSNFNYIALDLVPNALKEAYQRNITELLFGLKKNQVKPQPIYLAWDMEKEKIPFQSVSKVCCNLVLSYLTNPEKILNELKELLIPGGKILISSLKPYVDLSPVYSNLISVASDKELLARARKLLSGAGIIKQKEKEGHYKFFSDEELARLLAEAGFINIKTQRAFSDQVIIATADKPNPP